jgi:HAD superfamily hydrolase (TIGR01509 family)
MIRALVFDFDGLIVDTEGPDCQAWQELFASYGCVFDTDRWCAMIGGAAEGAAVYDPYVELAAQLNRTVDREEVRLRRRTRLTELVAVQPVRPGVAQYLAEAGRLGLSMAVASSGTRDWVCGHLERLDLIGRFHCVKCAEDVPRIKPDPVLYRAAVQELGVDPSEAIAFEDSPSGVLAARRAGLFCVAVPNLLTRHHPFEHADLRLDSLADLSLSDLLARLTVSGGLP